MRDRVSVPEVFQPLVYLDQAENVVLMLMLHECTKHYVDESNFYVNSKRYTIMNHYTSMEQPNNEFLSKAFSKILNKFGGV
jgi:hypothetical protein